MKNNMRKWMNITEGRIDELFTGDIDLDIKPVFHEAGANFFFDVNGNTVGTYFSERHDKQSVVVDNDKLSSSTVYECTFAIMDDDSDDKFKPTGNNKGQFLILEGVVRSIKLFLEKNPNVIICFSGKKDTGQAKLYDLILKKIKSDLAAIGYKSLEYKVYKMLDDIAQFGVMPSNWTIPSKEELKKFRDEMEKEEEEVPPSDIEQLSPDEFDELMAFLKKEGTI